MWITLKLFSWTKDILCNKATQPRWILIFIFKIIIWPTTFYIPVHIFSKQYIFRSKSSGDFIYGKLFKVILLYSYACMFAMNFKKAGPILIKCCIFSTHRNKSFYGHDYSILLAFRYQTLILKTNPTKPAVIFKSR